VLFHTAPCIFILYADEINLERLSSLAGGPGPRVRESRAEMGIWVSESAAYVFAHRP
jgi:hypothetical protein